jgi:hypothetical protein
MTGDATFILQRKREVLYAPSSYIKSEGKKKYVNIMRNNKKEKAYIKVGLEGDNRVEILDGPAEGIMIYD